MARRFAGTFPAGDPDSEVPFLYTHPHWIRLALPVLNLAAALAVLTFVRIQFLHGRNASAIFLLAIPFVLRLVERGIQMWSTTYVATTRSIGLRRVFLTRRERSIRLQKVNDIRLSQGLIQRLLHCGDLIVESSGEVDQLVLRYVPYVRELHETLTRLIKKEEDRGSSPWP
jgi:uncharacterized membrane protein YdbT with pleckstrin-like domain